MQCTAIALTWAHIFPVTNMREIVEIFEKTASEADTSRVGPLTSARMARAGYVHRQAPAEDKHRQTDAHQIFLLWGPGILKNYV